VSEQDMSAFLGIFLDEVEEQLQILDEEILVLEKDPRGKETIQKIFRAAHTLKGSSAAMGFVHMKELTHAMENVFDGIRHEQIQVDVPLINVIFECIDYLKSMKEAIVNGRKTNPDLGPLLHKLEDIKGNKDRANSREGELEEAVGVPAPVLQGWKLEEHQAAAIRASLAEGYRAMVIDICLSSHAPMKSVRTLLVHNNLKEVGEIIAAFPPINEMEDQGAEIDHPIFILVTPSSRQEVLHILEQISELEAVSIQLITEQNLPGLSLGQERTSRDRSAEHDAVVRSEMGNTPQGDGGRIKVNPTVRVDVDRLEALMNLVGELVIDQTRLVEVKNRFVSGETLEDDKDILSDVTNHLTRVITELQEGMMKTRMLPIEQLFNRLPRVVRDVALKAGKDIELVIEGKETELDRTLIEEIGDPLIHLLRNAVDHGIERPDDRAASGKPRKGRLLLKAAHEENNIMITIRDDGKGMDPAKIKQSAVSKGMLTEEEAERLSDRDAIFLIFQSGFSTAEKVTDISGRGVGMDIVRTHIEKLNGVIDIDSTPGEGTTFTIKLPLTLAIIRSLLVKLSEQTFSVPLVNVLEIMNLSHDEVKMVKNREVAVVRGRVLPLVRMHKQLGLTEEKKESKKRILVVVIGLAEKRVGLIVEKTLANQEVVIKSLGKFLGNPPYLSGATILGDGNVALILDVGSIVKEEGTYELDQPMEESKKELLREDETQLVTFMLDSEEYGLKIDQVKDIILVPSITRVVEAPPAVMGIANVRGCLVPVIDMRRRFCLAAQEKTKKSRVILVEHQQQAVGLYVDQVTGVIQVHNNTMEAPPAAVQGKSDAVIQGLCKLDSRMILLPRLEAVMKKELLGDLLQEAGS
jgi:two-component system, chemotaxis family, sensor kinase CheA